MDAKIVRARIHLKTLETEILTYLKRPNIAAFPSKVNRKKRIAVVQFKLLHQPPLPLSITIGDIVHNARSSLDHLWAALIRSGHSMFPCFQDGAEWKCDRAKVLRRVPAGARAFIDGLQPSTGTEDGELLGILNVLSNRDKHRAINLTATNAKNCRLKLYSGSNPTYAIHFPLIDALDTNTAIKITGLTDDIMEGGVKVNMQGRFVVAFKDAQLVGENTRDLLKRILDAVETRIVPTLRQFVKP